MDFPFSHHQQGRIDFNTSLPTGKDFLISSVRTFSHHQSLYMEWVRKSFPVECGQGRIDSVKLSPSLLTIR